MMKVVYCAGPFRGPTPYDVELHVRDTEWMGFLVAYAEAVPLIPHSMYRFFDKSCNDEFWLEATLELLRRCDAILLHPRWEASSGTRGEKALAEELRLPVFIAVYNDNHIIDLPEAFCAWMRGTEERDDKR